MKAKRDKRPCADIGTKNMPRQGVRCPAMLYKHARGWLCYGMTKSSSTCCERVEGALASCEAARQGGVHARTVRA